MSVHPAASAATTATAPAPAPAPAPGHGRPHDPLRPAGSGSGGVPIALIRSPDAADLHATPTGAMSTPGAGAGTPAHASTPTAANRPHLLKKPRLDGAAAVDAAAGAAMPHPSAAGPAIHGRHAASAPHATSGFHTPPLGSTRHSLASGATRDDATSGVSSATHSGPPSPPSAAAPPAAASRGGPLPPPLAAAAPPPPMSAVPPAGVSGPPPPPAAAMAAVSPHPAAAPPPPPPPPPAAAAVGAAPVVASPATPVAPPMVPHLIAGAENAVFTDVRLYTIPPAYRQRVRHLGATTYEGVRTNAPEAVASAEDLHLNLLPPFTAKDHYSTIEVRIPSEFLTWRSLAIKHKAVWGTDIYSDDSDMVATLVHSGRYVPADAPAEVVHLAREALAYAEHVAATDPAMAALEQELERMARMTPEELARTVSEPETTDTTTETTAAAAAAAAADAPMTTPPSAMAPPAASTASGAPLPGGFPPAPSAAATAHPMGCMPPPRPIIAAGMEPHDLSVRVRVLPRLVKYAGSIQHGLGSRSWGMHNGESIRIERVTLHPAGWSRQRGRKAGSKRWLRQAEGVQRSEAELQRYQNARAQELAQHIPLHDLVRPVAYTLVHAQAGGAARRHGPRRRPSFLADGQPLYKYHPMLLTSWPLLLTDFALLHFGDEKRLATRRSPGATGAAASGTGTATSTRRQTAAAAAAAAAAASPRTAARTAAFLQAEAAVMEARQTKKFGLTPPEVAARGHWAYWMFLAHDPQGDPIRLLTREGHWVLIEKAASEGAPASDGRADGAHGAGASDDTAMADADGPMAAPSAPSGEPASAASTAASASAAGTAAAAAPPTLRVRVAEWADGDLRAAPVWSTAVAADRVAFGPHGVTVHVPPERPKLGAPYAAPTEARDHYWVVEAFTVGTPTSPPARGTASEPPAASPP
ncbi:hypothetical protein CXG81DRAFT_23340 [Caulochytrium protostelioides]|uniref:Uncharacterized protein n=1 Tax=Caulochytrium protostelioides TaxID=1555241 RepID=A0A4P9XEU0_9FUNG|nr:hypothetical protein CXG81DRAFT_23340 [Caulochytrium protostelioides]|eukprot:RKP04083.1 hypothetical protein CXG81DRAFT_23340 [Caulochytrium protostelioides]